MTDVLFRPATRADIPAIVNLLADDQLGASRESPDDLASYESAFAEIAGNPAIELVVAEVDDAVIGTAQVTYIPGLSHRGKIRADIEAVRIASSLRCGGYGSAMIEHCIALAEARGASMVQLTSNASRGAAHRFYLRLGFAQSHLGFKMKLPRSLIS